MESAGDVAIKMGEKRREIIILRLIFISVIIAFLSPPNTFASMLADFENQSLWMYKPADAEINYSRIIKSFLIFLPGIKF